MKCYILKIVDEKNKTLKWNIEFVNEILKYKDWAVKIGWWMLEWNG
jgi:hypothetical protein